MSAALGIDYAWHHPNPAAIKAAGYSFVIRYLSHDPTKDITAAEVAELHAAGLGILLVFETAAGRATQGFAAGEADAEEAARRALALGYPDVCPLFFAVDTDATVSAVEQYFAAAKRFCPPAGVYGGIDVVDSLLAAGGVHFGWQTDAWSGVAVSTRAQLYQRKHPTLGGLLAGPAGDFDEDVVLQPLSVWGAPAATKPTPAPTPAPTDWSLTVQTIDLRNAATAPVRGASVKALQTLLNLDYGGRLVIDGVAGEMTRAALGQFQEQHQETVDYIAGPGTWGALCSQ
jgi:hypothetical protein